MLALLMNSAYSLPGLYILRRRTEKRYSNQPEKLKTGYGSQVR
jgi:hypothetical protein